MDDFFHIASRMIPIIAIVIIIIGLLIKFNKNQVVSPARVVVSPTPLSRVNNPLSRPTPTVAQIDLAGPWICQFSSPTATISAYIKDKKIAAKIQSGKQSNNLIINGDCLYSYLQGSYSGEKICGISTYLSLFNSLPLNMLDNNLFKTMLPGSPAVDIDNLKKGLNSCKKQEIKDEAIFTIPKSILFKTK